MKAWIVDAAEALKAWQHPDQSLRLEVSIWLRSMRRWGPPKPPELAPVRGGSAIHLAMHAPTGILMMVTIGRYPPDHLFEGYVKVLKILEP